MRSFRDRPISQKLTLVIVLTSGVAIALATALILGYQMFTARLAAVYDLRTVADVIAVTTVDELELRENKAAERTLATLRTRPEILVASVLDADGNVFAQYAKTGVDVNQFGPNPPVGRHWFEGAQLVLSHYILVGGEPIGAVVLRSDRSEEQLRLRYSVIIVTILMAAAVCIALLLAARLQQVVSRPIRHLADVARAVATEKNYSLRAEPEGQDETGVLVGAFNQMLDQIQRRDEDLRASELRFRQLAETITQVFWITDAERKQMIYVSPAYEQIWARTCESLYRSPGDWNEAIHPEDRARATQAIQTKQTRGEYEEEYRIVRPTGSVRWIRDRAFPVRDSEGKVYRLVGIAEDITERKQAAEALRLQAEIARNLEEGIQMVRARDSLIVYANPKFERMFGYSPGELIGQPVAVLNAVSSGDPSRVADELLEKLKGTGTWSGEIHNRKKDGTEFWCYVNISKFQHPEHGEVWINVHTDITERKRTEDLLREAEAKFRLLVEQVPAITYTAELGARGRWHYISPQVESLLGYSASEWLQDVGLWMECIHPADRRLVLTAEEEARAGGKYSAEYRLITRAGREVWVRDEGVIVPASGGQPEIIQGVIQDVTQRKELEKRILEVSDREQRRIGQDLHDGLCQVITGATFALKTLEEKLAAAGFAEAADAQEIAALLRRANVEARNVARGLHPVELEAGGLAAALREMAINAQSLFEVACRFHGESPVTLADADKAVHVYRIAQEAVNNALKHSGAKHIGITLSQDDGSLTLTVDDDGIGIPARIEERRGMGLNIMAYRARMIGGSLQVARGSRGGTVVSLVFPNA